MVTAAFSWILTPCRGRVKPGWVLLEVLRPVAAGRPWNHKRVHRVSCAVRLNLPRRTRRRLLRRIPHPLEAPPVLNHTWAIDYMCDTLYDGRSIGS